MKAATPEPISPPIVPGGAQQGKQLVLSHGSWTNEPTGYEDQWLRCEEAGEPCEQISGATGESYVPSEEDVGHRLRVEEIAINGGGKSHGVRSAATSTVLPAVPVDLELPTITGEDTEGDTLTEHHGSWTNSPTSYGLRWLRCDALGEGCLPIVGAEGTTYKLTSFDVGARIRVEEIARNSGGPGQGALSEPTRSISSAVPVEVSRPSIAGPAEEGQTLVEQHGTWTNEPTGYEYQWLRCNHEGGECTEIEGAVDQTFAVTGAYTGDRLEVREIALNGGGASAGASSLPSAVVTRVPLRAVAGEEIRTTPGATVDFDASGSTPAGQITSYVWEFSDAEGTTVEGVHVQHQFPAGNWTAKLTVRRGEEEAKSSVSVTSSSPTHTATVEVTDASHTPLAGATVLYISPEKVRVQGVTGGDGKVTLAGLPDGADAVYAYKSGYQPAVGHIQISGEAGETTIALAGGEVVASTLDSKELNRREIEEAGIDPTAPGNQMVYEFEVRLAFIESPHEPVQFHCYINEHGEFVGGCTGGGGGGGGGWGPGGGPGGPSCSPHECVGGGIVAVPTVVQGQPLIEWLILRCKASTLKQFFQVSQVIENLSPAPFKLAKGTSTLSIPGGMSLAPTATPQSAGQTVEAVPGGSSKEVSWIVRGDVPGEYFLSASYQSYLEPFEPSEASVSVEARLASPLKVWGVEALSLTVQADEGALAAGRPYHVHIGVSNKADIPLYNVAVEVFLNVHERFIFQPLQEAAHQIDELKPGETVYAPEDILVPDAASVSKFNPALSSAHFVGQEIHPGEGIEEVEPPPLQELTGTIDGTGLVHLRWTPTPEAQGYEVFSTPDLDTSFGEAPEDALLTKDSTEPVMRLPADATEAFVPGGNPEEPNFYTVTSIVHGVPRLEVPVIKPVRAKTAAPPTVETQQPAELEPTVAVLAGSVNPNGANVSDCHFEIGSTTSYGRSVPCKENVGGGEDPVAVTAKVEELQEGAEYHVRLVAKNLEGTTVGGDVAFKTPVPGPPNPTTEAATEPSATGVTLNGTVVPDGFAITDCHFEYGIGALTSKAPCSQSPGTLGSGFKKAKVSARISNLKPSQTYEYRLVATNSQGTGTGQIATFVSCDAYEVKFGEVQALGCFTQAAAGMFESHAKIRVNGIDFEPHGGASLLIDEAKQVLDTSGSVGINVGGTLAVGTISGNLALKIGAGYDLNLSSVQKVFHLPVIPSLHIKPKKITKEKEPDDYGTEISGEVSLQPLGDPSTASLGVITDNKSGLTAFTAEVKPAHADTSRNPGEKCDPGKPVTGYECVEESGGGYRLVSKEPGIMKLGGKLGIADLKLVYDFVHKDLELEGRIRLGSIIPTPEIFGQKIQLAKEAELFVKGSVGLSPFEIRKIKIQAQKLGLNLAAVHAELEEMSFELGFSPFSIGGGVKATFLKDLPLLKKGVSVDAGFSYTQGTQSGFDLDVHGGPFYLWDLPLDGSLELDLRNGTVKFVVGGEFEQEWADGVVTAKASVKGGAEFKPHFHIQLKGKGSIKVFAAELGAQALVSDAGIRACGELQILAWHGEVGFKHFWSGETDFNGCDFSGLYTLGAGAADRISAAAAASAAAAGEPITIPSGRAREEFVAVGNTEPPRVALIGPGKYKLETPSTPDKLTAVGNAVAVAVSSSDSTYFIVNNPSAGKWHIAPLKNAPPPERVEYAAPFEPVALSASVTGTGYARTLHWSYAAQHGVTIDLVEEGGATQTLVEGATKGGTAGFEVSPGPAGERTIVAQVYVDGVLKETLTVASFTAPAPRPPVLPRTGAVRHSFHGGVLTVMWLPVAEAEDYEVEVRDKHGTLRYLIPGGTTETSIELPAGITPKKVAVITLAGGLTGPPRKG